MLRHAHVGVQPVVLEDHRDVPVADVQVVDAPIAEEEVTLIAASSPEIIRSRVVSLADPDGPTRTMNSWSLISRVQSRNTGSPAPKFFHKSRTVMLVIASLQLAWVLVRRLRLADPTFCSPAVRRRQSMSRR